MIKITLLVFIINHAIPTLPEKIAFENTLKSYAAQVNVDLNIVRKPLKERMCTKRYSSWDDKFAYYTCLKRYKKQKYTFFVRGPYITVENGITWSRCGGLAAVCVRNNTGIGVAAYTSFIALSCTVAASHEVFHMLGAPHQEVDPLEIMYPAFYSQVINKYGGMTVGQSTKDNITQCIG